MEANQKIEYLKSMLKKTLELYRKEKTRPTGVRRRKPKPYIFKGEEGLKDSGIITQAELASNGYYSLGNNSWEKENGEIVTVKIEMP
jgi:hypothetical protein